MWTRRVALNLCKRMSSWPALRCSAGLSLTVRFGLCSFPETIFGAACLDGKPSLSTSDLDSGKVRASFLSQQTRSLHHISARLAIGKSHLCDSRRWLFDDFTVLVKEGNSSIPYRFAVLVITAFNSWRTSAGTSGGWYAAIRTWARSRACCTTFVRGVRNDSSFWFVRPALS